MATLSTLVKRGDLFQFPIELNAGECPDRMLYVTEDAGRWLQDELPKLATAIAGGRTDPLEQVDSFLYRFARGEKLICENGRDLKELSPVKHEVWELKTIDVRFFGWFYTPHIFICIAVEYKNRLVSMKREKNINLYDIYRNATLRFRDNLDLDPPKLADRRDVLNEFCIEN